MFLSHFRQEHYLNTHHLYQIETSIMGLSMTCCYHIDFQEEIVHSTPTHTRSLYVFSRSMVIKVEQLLWYDTCDTLRSDGYK